MTTPPGRAAEHARLTALLGAGGRVVAVTGEAGIGKSHLIAAAVDAATTVVWVSFPSGRFPAPGAGLRRLAAAVPRPNPLATELDAPGDQAGKTFAIWNAADAVLAAAAPGTLVLDDLQWADDLTLSWLAQAGDAVARSGATLVLGVRATEALPDRVEDVLLPLARRGVLDRLDVGPLDAVAVREVARSLGVACDDAAAAALHARTEGLPLAIVDLVRHLVRGGARTVAPDDVARAGVRHALPLLSALVREQLAALPPDACDLVGTAALLPAPRAETVLAAACGWPAGRFDEALAAAYASGLVVDGGDGVAFRHELHREVVAAALPLPDRRARHRRVAEVLQRAPGRSASHVAAQYLEAGDARAALDWLEQAAVEARMAFDHGAALTAVGAALPLARAVDQSRVRWLVDKTVMAAQWSLRHDEGLAFLAAAMRDATTARERGWLLDGQSRLLAYTGDYVTRHDRLVAAVREFREANERVGVAHALSHLAFPVSSLLPLATCAEHAREAWQIAQEVDDAPLRMVCGATAALATLFAGGDDRPYWESAAAVAGGDAPVEAHAARSLYFNWACTRVSGGWYADAARVVAEGRRSCAGTFADAAFGAVEAMLLWRTGEWEAARRLAETTAAAPGYVQAVPAELVLAVIGYERERRFDPARLERPTDVLVRQRNAAWAPIAQAELMRVRAARREPRPERGFAESIEQIAARGLATGWEDLVAAAAEVAPDAATAALVRLDGLWPVGPRAAAARHYVDGLLARRGDATRAAESLLAAADAFGALPEPMARGRALDAAAGCLRRRGDRRAGLLRAEAAEVYRAIGADRSLAQLLRRGGRARDLATYRVPESQAHSGALGLTPRQREVAELARQGLTVAEIAERLAISYGTARNHLAEVRGKLGGVRKRDLPRVLGAG